MKTLFVIGVVIVAVVYLLRYLRKREMDAFMDADMSDFQEFRRVAAQKTEKADPLMARVEAIAATNPNVIPMPAQESEPESDINSLDSMVQSVEEDDTDTLDDSLPKLVTLLASSSYSSAPTSSLAQTTSFLRTPLSRFSDAGRTAPRVSPHEHA